jgi:hypothetical protein
MLNSLFPALVLVEGLKLGPSRPYRLEAGVWSSRRCPSSICGNGPWPSSSGSKGKLVANANHDQAINVATQASVKLVSDVPAHAVQEMTERMASLVADSAARYFNGDTKAALAAQAVLLRQMAGDSAMQDSLGVLAEVRDTEVLVGDSFESF